MKDFHSEYNGKSLFDNLKCQIIMLYATPPPYTEEAFQKAMNIITRIKEKSEAQVELVPIKGKHHFHMLNPVEAADLVFKVGNRTIFKNLVRIIFKLMKLKQFF